MIELNNKDKKKDRKVVDYEEFKFYFITMNNSLNKFDYQRRVFLLHRDALSLL